MPEHSTPLATGLLIVCSVKPPKQAETIQAQQKEYIAEICFGVTTTHRMT